MFFALGALQVGQRIEIARADGTTAVFEVDHVASFFKDSFPTRAVYGYTDDSALRLVTCGGTFDRATGNYRNDIVVFAHLIEPVRAKARPIPCRCRTSALGPTRLGPFAAQLF